MFTRRVERWNRLSKRNVLRRRKVTRPTLGQNVVPVVLTASSDDLMH